ncbi:hypothetical protein D3C77_537880 [compost metagenome]
MAGQQAGVAVGVLHRHPALISQADDDLGPVQVFAGKLFEERYRATAAGQHHAGVPLGGDGRAQALGHVMGLGRRQGIGIRQFVHLHGCRQFQFRYRLRCRHTRLSRRV